MKIRSWIVTISISFVAIAALGGIKAWQISNAIAFAEAMPEFSETVVAVNAEPYDYKKTLTVTGEVLAPRQVSLYTEIPGRITRVGFESGGVVSKGQLLLELDSSEEEAQLASANANLKLAERLFVRAQNLRKTNAVSEEHMDRARLDLATAKAEIVRLVSVIRKKKVLAPFSGQVGLHQFEVGQYINANTMITEVVNHETGLWVDFKVPQLYPVLDKGATVEVASINSHSKEFAAQVLSKQPSVEQASRSVAYRSLISGDDIGIEVNSVVSVKVPVASAENKLQLPINALQQDSLGHFVYTLKPEENGQQFRAVRTNVVVVEKLSDKFVLNADIDMDTKIAGDGAFKLFPNLLVNVAAQ